MQHSNDQNQQNCERELQDKLEIITEKHEILQSSYKDLKTTNKNLKKAYKELYGIFENNITGVLYSNSDNIVREANQQALLILGFSDKEEFLGKNICQLKFLDITNEELSNVYDDISPFDGVAQFETRYKDNDDNLIWLSITGQAISLTTIRNITSHGILWTFTNITDRKDAEESLRLANRELEAFFNNDIAGIFISRRGKVVKSNHCFASMFKYASSADINGINIEDIHITPEKGAEFTDKMMHMLKDGNNILIEYQFRCRDNSIIWCQCHGQALDPSNYKKGFFWIIEDITDRKEAEEKLITLATIDELSQTCNRRYFMELIGHELLRHERNGQPISLLMLDIDKFKSINDTYGHSVGDQTITLFAATCKETLRAIDKIGRLGGDEFCIFLPETSSQDALMIAERIKIKIGKLHESAADIPKFTTSIGVRSLTECNSKDIDHYIAQADEALYQSKDRGRNCVSLYSKKEYFI